MADHLIPLYGQSGKKYLYISYFFSLIVHIKKYNIKLIFIIYLIFLFLDKFKFAEINFIKDFIYLAYFIDFVRLFFSAFLFF